MQKTKTNKVAKYLKWIGWIVVVQFILANISASIYAYRFTHFYDGPSPKTSSRNIFEKTWKLFTGPKFYKLTAEPEPSFPYQTITLTTENKIAIDAWYSGVDSAKGCVIFFHGITVNKSFLVEEASMFRNWGYSVLLIDFRAHGKSGGHTSTFGVDETDEVQKAFAWAQSKGYNNIFLYGVSLGAATVLKAASEGKVKPAGIIADAPFDNLHNHFKARARDVGFPAQPFAFLVTMWIGIERGFNGFNHDVESYGKNVTCPVLIQWGEKDQYISHSAIENVYNSLPSQKKKLVVYSDANHESYLHIDPAKWQKEMQGFLTALH